MTQLLCATNQTIPPLLSQDEMKVKVYNPGGISHDAALPLPLPLPTWFHPVWDSILWYRTKNYFCSVHKQSTLTARLII
jgi:hypothetical protein